MKIVKEKLQNLKKKTLPDRAVVVVFLQGGQAKAQVSPPSQQVG